MANNLQVYILFPPEYIPVDLSLIHISCNNSFTYSDLHTSFFLALATASSILRVRSLPTLPVLIYSYNLSLIHILNIAAISNQEEKYIVFSKKMICWKWENEHQTEAWQELQEWLEMLPEDSELRNMERAFRK